MARDPQYGFFPAPGADYSVGVEPRLATRLNRLGRALQLHLVGISGFRTPAHSIEVGGFADDPHTQGGASDTPGIEGVPEGVLNRYGLTRPFGGPAEADHIQLLGWKGGRTTVRNRGQTPSLADLWIQAGGARNLAPIMAAIAMAESGGRADAVGGPNDDGTYDYGPWQINSSHTQFNKAKLISDPLYNARAAVAVERSQGLGAWSTYSSGAFKSFLGGSRYAGPTFGRTRPGGGDPGPQGPDGIDAAFTSYIDESTNTQNVSLLGDALRGIPNPLAPLLLPGYNPLKTFKDTKDAINNTADFLKWVAWIFHPRNVLRIVEFLTGLTIMGFGIHTIIEAHRDGTSEGSTIGRTAKNVATITPVGRSVKVAQAARSGKRAARLEARRAETRQAHVRARNKEHGRQKTKSNEREMNRRYGGVPF